MVTATVKHLLGISVQSSEGANFWSGMRAELRNRGVRCGKVNYYRPCE